MRVWNVWFDGLSLLVAILMLGCATCAVAYYVLADDNSLFGTVCVGGIFIGLGTLYAWLSLRKGNEQKRTRHMTRRND